MLSFLSSQLPNHVSTKDIDDTKEISCEHPKVGTQKGDQLGEKGRIPIGRALIRRGIFLANIGGGIRKDVIVDIRVGNACVIEPEGQEVGYK